MESMEARAATLQQAFWLASRGAQQMDLAVRLSEAAASRGLRVLALKGISIADQLYGGVHNRPMGDIDLLVVDRSQFVAASDLARSFGMLEIGASDHALVFKEPVTGAVLEWHVSLTACPGLFRVNGDSLWEQRVAVAGTPVFRLSDVDLVVHLALHTAFQHGFAANEYHYGDFVRAIDTLAPRVDDLEARAHRWGALPTLGAMAVACGRLGPPSAALSSLLDRVRQACPRAISRWIEARPRMPTTASLASLAFVRYHLAPSKWTYLRRSVLPEPIPGRTLARPGVIRRLVNLLDAA